MKTMFPMKDPDLPLPQTYEHRVECVLEALQASVEALTHLTSFLLDQLSPDWQDLDRPLKAYRARTRAAGRWVRKALRPLSLRRKTCVRRTRARASKRAATRSVKRVTG